MCTEVQLKIIAAKRQGLRLKETAPLRHKQRDGRGGPPIHNVRLAATKSRRVRREKLSD